MGTTNLDLEIERLEKIVDKKRNDFVFTESTSFDEFNKCAEPESSQLYLLYSQRRMNTEDFELKEIPSYGDHMSMEDFVECCKCGGFIDYDGHGNYATKTEVSDIVIYPSDVKNGFIRKDFDFVVWMNR